MRYKLGRLPRKFKHVPHLSAIFAGLQLPAPPASVDWTKGQTDFGMMLNDTLGDCTCAAIYHARQIWTNNTTAEDTQPDSVVQSLYSAACGYVPGDSSSDQGGNEQDLLDFWMKTGIPLADGSVDNLLARFEVDPRNCTDLQRVIAECGLAYIGVNLPNDINEEPGSTWDYTGAPTEGGHAVIIVGYDTATKLYKIISWGGIYYLTEAFIQNQVDEAYAPIDKNWLLSTGKTPFGLTESQTVAAMRANH